MRQSQLEAHEKTLNQVIGGIAKASLEKTGERTPEPCREEIPFLDDNLVYFRRVSNQPEEKLKTKLLDLIYIFSKSFFFARTWRIWYFSTFRSIGYRKRPIPIGWHRRLCTAELFVTPENS